MSKWQNHQFRNIHFLRNYSTSASYSLNVKFALSEFLLSKYTMFFIHTNWITLHQVNILLVEFLTMWIRIKEGPGVIVYVSKYLHQKQIVQSNYTCHSCTSKTSYWTQLQWINIFGAKYLGFFSFRCLKTRKNILWSIHWIYWNQIHKSKSKTSKYFLFFKWKFDDFFYT